MLKKRIIPKFLIRGGRLVKMRRFTEDQREAGNPVSTRTRVTIRKGSGAE